MGSGFGYISLPCQSPQTWAGFSQIQKFHKKICAIQTSKWLYNKNNVRAKEKISETKSCWYFRCWSFKTGRKYTWINEWRLHSNAKEKNVQTSTDTWFNSPNPSAGSSSPRRLSLSPSLPVHSLHVIMALSPSVCLFLLSVWMVSSSVFAWPVLFHLYGGCVALCGSDSGRHPKLLSWIHYLHLWQNVMCVTMCAVILCCEAILYTCMSVYPGRGIPRLVLPEDSPRSLPCSNCAFSSFESRAVVKCLTD